MRPSVATTITHSWTVVAQEDLSITSFSLNIWLKKREDWQVFLIISKTLASVNNSGNIGKHNDIFNIQYHPPPWHLSRESTKNVRISFNQNWEADQ